MCHETFLNGTKNSWVTKHFSGSKDGGSIIDYLTSQRMLGNYGISNLWEETIKWRNTNKKYLNDSKD